MTKYNYDVTYKVNRISVTDSKCIILIGNTVGLVSWQTYSRVDRAVPLAEGCSREAAETKL